jgi:hypothetical protein
LDGEIQSNEKIVLLKAFWCRVQVKNVSGRLLVGLRWWNNVKEDGTNEWIFESLEDMSQIGYMDSRIFWWSLYVTPAIWAVFCFVSLLKFDLSWCVMCSIAITLSSANIYGYTKCRCVRDMRMLDLRLLAHIVSLLHPTARKQKLSWRKQGTSQALLRASVGQQAPLVSWGRTLGQLRC